MNNDLISREALKKCAIPCEIHNGALTELCVPLYQIVNAPTVEPEITNDDLQAAMTESYHLGYELAETKFKRPQGEWVEFAKFVASEVCDEYFANYADSFAEVACRKLVELGLLKLDGDTYRQKGGAE